MAIHLIDILKFVKQHLPPNHMSSWAKTSLDRSGKKDFEILLSFHSDTKDDHAVNSLLGIFQKTSSNTYFLLSRNLMGGIMQ